MDVAAELNLGFFVGHMDPVECEHSQHDMSGAHHGGYATMYVRFVCPHCGDMSDVLPICQPFADFMFSGGLLGCDDCKTVHPGRLMLRIVRRIT